MIAAWLGAFSQDGVRSQEKGTTDIPQLPWNGALGADSSVGPATSARKLFINVDDSELNRIIDGQPFGPSDEETLVRILYRLPAIQLDDTERLTRREVTWQRLAEEPAKFRAEFFRLTGRVTEIARVDVLREVANRLDFDHYFRVTFQLDNAPNPVLIFSRNVPQRWVAAPPRDERASAYGLFIKVGEPNESHPQLVFAAQRVAWHPDRIEPESGIDVDHVTLAKLGFDIGLLDGIKHSNFREITSHDRECFYQMLSAVGHADAAQLKTVTEPFSLPDLLREPQAHHGQLGSVRGIARRVTKISVTDADIRDRFQIDHYYQIDVFLPLGDQVIRVDSPGSKKDGPVYYGSFPVTVCVLRLPPELPESLNPRREVTIPAFFFKVWAYKSEFVTAVEKGQLQRSPMFIALEPIVLPSKRVFNPVAYLSIIVFVTTASVFTFGMWWQSRAKKRRREQLARSGSGPSSSLNDLNLKFPDK